MATSGPVRWICGVVALVLGGFLTTPGGAAAVISPGAARDVGLAAVMAKYREQIPELMAEQDVPGLSLAVVDGDHVVWQQGFGSTDEGGRPVTVDTMFSAQSMSKVFTATAVMQAVQSGLLDLDEPITTYVPGFTVHSAFESHPESRITLRMLLSHTAGFTHEAPLGNNYEPEPGTFDAHVRTISDTWLRFPVGTGYAYSNLGIDLAGYILERVSGKPYAAVMQDVLLEPLGMGHSTFVRARVRATEDRAVGHSGWVAPQPVDIPMTAAGGLWTTAADLARFLELQLGDGTIGGRTLLDPALMTEMRTVPAPHAGAAAGYALGVGRTHWRAVKYLDLFSHGGGGFGFLADLWWVPQLQLGIAVLTNSDQHTLQGVLALGILQDLVSEPGSIYHDRMLDLSPQTDVLDSGDFVGPPHLADEIAALALPASPAQAARWAGYEGFYRAGQRGSIDPSDPASQFRVQSGNAYFDAGEDGTLVRHRLTEFRPGLFLTENGETLDLREPSPRWRGLDLNPVTNGPLAWQWALLAAVAVVAVGWFVASGVGWVRRRRTEARRPFAVETGSSAVRNVTTTVAALGALAALAAVAAIRLLPGLVDVGFLGELGSPLPVRLSLHLPLALAVLATGLTVLLVAGAVRRWWTPRVRPQDAVLAGALLALTAQLAGWGVIGWGF